MWGLRTASWPQYMYIMIITVMRFLDSRRFRLALAQRATTGLRNHSTSFLVPIRNRALEIGNPSIEFV